MGRSVQNWALDTFVSVHNPSTTYESNQYTWITRNERQGYIQMSNPAPLGATILSAKLRLRSTTTQSTAFVALGRCRARPSYGHMAWSNRREAVSGSEVVVTQSAGATTWEFDVTDHMQVVADGGNWYGWVLRIQNTAGNVRFYSQESGRGPELEVEWSDAPDPPTMLQPSGGRAVASTHPRVRFNYVDVSGDTTLTAIQVQISGSESFAAPMFDSGRVLTSKPEYDLDGTSYTGAVSGQTHYWRVRAQDGAGLWSGWSEPRSFTYEGKGTLEVITPSVTGLTISDDTPLVAWQMTGRQQAAYQVIVTWVQRPSVWLWTSGKITSDTTSITIPKGPISRDDRTYRITVRTWDTIDRVNTPGDPRNYQVQRDVTFDEDQDVLPVDSLVADAPAYSPEVELTATRAATPDRWMILRGNEIIHSAAGLDLWVEGTTYRYVDRTAPGMTEARYRFQPVENNERAWGNPLSAVIPDPGYLWVVSLDGSIKVPLVGRADEGATVEWEPQSQVELLTPLGARRPIMVRHSLGARVGTVTGIVATDIPGVDATTAELKSALAQLEAAGEQVRLVAGDENVPVIIHDLNMETRRYEGFGGVEFSVFQDGEFPDEDP